ncbi:MAG: sensor histidine kinase [Planctomycetota bacterium]|jgi:hypothetical protein
MSRPLLVDRLAPISHCMSNLSSDEPTTVARQPARFGRLVPLAGIAVRPHPERAQVRQFLRELQLPLAAQQGLLDLIDEAAVPPSLQRALQAVLEHNRYLLELVGEYREVGELEVDGVHPVATRLTLANWLAANLSAWHVDAERNGHALQVVHRSFLPSHVLVDARLLLRAVEAVLQVAFARALRGTVELRLAYVHGRVQNGPGQLRLEVVSGGGGFSELEQGYAFAPFQVLDAAERPRLGLAIAQRLCALLGGVLTIDSRGRASCCYRIELPMAATADAQWFDPVVGASRLLGPVHPGRVLFVGCVDDVRTLCTPLLLRTGFTVVGCGGGADAVARTLAEDPAGWSACVFADEGCWQAAAPSLAAARAAGFRGVVVVESGQDAAHVPYVPCRQLSGRALAELLGSGRYAGLADG